MSVIPSATLSSYQETDYRVFLEPPLVLHIGVASKELSVLYFQFNTDSAAFITAGNPYSQPLAAAANAMRQAELAAELKQRGLSFFEGEGRHPSGDWAEPSYLVLGLSLDEAKAMGRRCEQNAVVWCGADAVPELVLLR